MVESLRVAAANLELAERRVYDSQRLSESAADLERRLFDPGWRRFEAQTEAEFTPEGRRQMRAVCRLSATASALIKRGLALRAAYVHASGVSVTARANGQKRGEQDVHAVIDGFWSNPANQRALTGGAARQRLERTLGTDGEFFVALFTRPMTGDVQARVVLTDEIVEIFCNPDDRTEPRYFKRSWVEETHDDNGVPVQKQRECLYPAVDYRPKRKPRTYAGVEVMWDAPMIQVDVNRPEHWQRGVPDAYAAINWAHAYKKYLEEWSSLMSALSRFAFKATSRTPAQAAALRAKTAVIPVDPTTGEGRSGGTLSLPDGANLEAIPKSGATIDAESGRPLAMMVAAGLGVPVTMLLADPGQTGARATAETLDTPTELEMGSRREVWTDLIRRICGWVVASSVRAPKGKLRGKIVHESWGDTESVELRGNTDPTIDVDWPDLDETSTKDEIAAIIEANSAGVIPAEQILRLLLAALGVRDAESIVAAVMEKQEAEAAAAVAAGQPGADPAVTPPASGVGGNAEQPALPAGTSAAPVDTPLAGGQLVAQVLQHVAEADWARLDADAQALAAAEETNAAPAPDLPAHWADEQAVDNDWRTDAALARGADVAEAYGSQDPDDAGLRRGHDIAAAEAQVTGVAAPSLDEFTAAANAAKSYTPTLSLDNRVVATAFRLGRYSAVVGEPLAACPYRGGDGEQAALRRVWLTAYLRIRPAGTEAPVGQPTLDAEATQGTPDTEPAAPAGDDAALTEADRPIQGDVAVADFLAAADAGDWKQVDALAPKLKAAAEAADAPTPTLPAHWADARAVDNDWQVDAALARGAEVAAAYGSHKPDDASLRRGHDVDTADRVLAGEPARSFDEFTAEANGTRSYEPTASLDNRLVSAAMRAAHYAATVGAPITDCPYDSADPDQVALRRVWLTAYLRVRPADGGVDG